MTETDLLINAMRLLYGMIFTCSLLLHDDDIYDHIQPDLELIRRPVILSVQNKSETNIKGHQLRFSI